MKSIDSKMQIIVEAMLPTTWGEYRMILFQEESDENRLEHFALVHKDINVAQPVYVRIHSECLTGDLLTSLKCDCGEQLHKSMDIIQEQKGILIYLRQEGRGIGLANKLMAYNLQADGMDTIEANLHLGFKEDLRQYTLACEFLTWLGVKEINLISNNPEKLQAIEDSDIKLLNRVPIIIDPIAENLKYLNTKKDLMGHFLDD